MNDTIRINPTVSRPEEVLADRSMNLSEKRALLASWLSDARAPESMPGLRVLDTGALVSVGTIAEALTSLDDRASSNESVTPAASNRRLPPPYRRRLPRWTRVFVRPPRDDNEDPPPRPATNVAQAYMAASLSERL